MSQGVPLSLFQPLGMQVIKKAQDPGGEGIALGEGRGQWNQNNKQGHQLFKGAGGSLLLFIVRPVRSRLLCVPSAQCPSVRHHRGGLTDRCPRHQRLFIIINKLY